MVKWMKQTLICENRELLIFFKFFTDFQSISNVKFPLKNWKTNYNGWLLGNNSKMIPTIKYRSEVKIDVF